MMLPQDVLSFAACFATLITPPLRHDADYAIEMPPAPRCFAASSTPRLLSPMPAFDAIAAYAFID